MPHDFKKFRLKIGLLISLLFPLLVRAQYSNEIIAGNTLYTYLVGSLPPDGVNNLNKLQIDILGGNWLSNTIGITTYTVANRSGLAINQTTIGGATGNYTIKAYANPNGNTDIYIVETATYPAFAIKSCLFGGGNATQLQTIVQQTPVGTDITPVVSPLLITDAAGNMGIGTSNPNGFKLAVNGNVHAKQVNVDLTNWADYVFDKAYHLPSLTEIKTYIDQNHHLPEIPSAEQIEKDGLNLGEINKVLVKKVEELTLYLIERDKKEKTAFKEQQKEIDQLKQQLERVLKIHNKS
jgi:hypothetical protein